MITEPDREDVTAGGGLGHPVGERAHQTRPGQKTHRVRAGSPPRIGSLQDADERVGGDLVVAGQSRAVLQVEAVRGDTRGRQSILDRRGRTLVSGGIPGCSRSEAAILVGERVIGMGQHPAQLFTYRRGGYRREGGRSRGGFPGLAHAHRDSRRRESLRKNLGDMAGGIGVELDRALGGAPGIDRHRADVALIASDILSIPGRQVRRAIEERSPPVESDRGDAELRQRCGGILCQRL